MRSRLTNAMLATLVAAAALAAAPGRARAGDAVLDAYSATDRFRSGQPRAIAITPDDREVLFLRSGPRTRVHELWSHAVRGGGERMIVTADRLLSGAAVTMTPEERARRERLRQSALGITSFELSRDGRRLLVPLSGRLFVLERTSDGWGEPREIGAGGSPAFDARFSPDGARVACVRDRELHVVDVASGADRAIVRRDGDVTWGLPEFVAQEEMDRFEGYWWSPDSKWLAVQRTDESAVERLRILDPAHPEAAPDANPYPRPGKTNADVRLAIVPVDGGTPTWVDWDRTADPYLCRVRWDEHGPLAILVMDRAQQHETLLSVDPASGRTSPILGEHDDAWLNLPDGVPVWLADGRSFLWIAERDDTGPRLELQRADETAARLTPPGVRVSRLLAVDEAHRAAWVLASDEPTEQHVWRVDLRKPGVATRVSADAGLETATIARDGGVLVRAIEPLAGAARWLVEDARGRSLGELRSTAEAPPSEPRVEFTTVGEESLRACIVRPRDFDPRRRYPVVDWAYGGPHSLTVQRAARHYVLPQWLADRGFVVVSIDGRGTPHRGRAWERAIRGDFIGPALADHVAGLQALCARYPEMDPARIGVMGWSFGGYFSAQAVMRAPQTYRAAVAGAPVVDWHDYDTFYTERYLGVPPADSASYERSSVLPVAAGLSRPLLVIHGTADDNVYFLNSLKLADALDRANRPFEFLPLPGQTHAVVLPDYVRQIYLRAAEFLERTLGTAGGAAAGSPAGAGGSERR